MLMALGMGREGLQFTLELSPTGLFTDQRER